MQKTKKLIKRGLCLLLILTSLISTVAYAANDSGANSNNQDSSVGDPTTKGEQATKKQEGEVFNDLWQGLRVYVVDEQGFLVPNKNGETVVDYLYNPHLMTADNFNNDFNRYKSATGAPFKKIVYAPGAGDRSCWTRVGTH